VDLPALGFPATVTIPALGIQQFNAQVSAFRWRQQKRGDTN
jgi:hypothetical protein